MTTAPKARGVQAQLFESGRESGGLRTRHKLRNAVADRLEAMALEVEELARGLGQIPCQLARCKTLRITARRLRLAAEVVGSKRANA